MKLLILTQKVDINDDVLGFMHGWIAEFAKHCEKVTVICLQKGEYDLPENVKVLSLGKEKLFHCCVIKLLYCCRFYKYIWQERKNYDKVFVHMNTEYVVLGGWLWKLLNKKIGLWYAHGHVPFSLRMAEKLTDIIFTSTKSGCRLKSKKIKIVGQGIDVNKFQIADFRLPIENKNIFKIVTVGRISPVKDYETLIKAVEILCRNKALPCSCEVDIIGGVGLKGQEEYLNKLKKIVKNKGLDRIINFAGPVANKDIVNYLQTSDLFVNMSRTGSLDKAVLEAMACGLPVLTCNEALSNVLGKHRELLMFEKGDYRELAKKIELLTNKGRGQREMIGNSLRNIVVEEHGLNNLIIKILSILK